MGDATTNGAGQDEAALLREMMYRLLNSEMLGTISATVIEIVPGGLPTTTTLPFIPQLPPPHTLIGSVVKAMQVPPLETPSISGDIVFDTSLTPEEIFDFYSAQFPGWHSHRKRLDQLQHPKAKMQAPTKLYRCIFTQLDNDIPFRGMVVILVEQQASGVNGVRLILSPMRPPQEIQAEGKNRAALKIWQVFKPLEGTEGVFTRAEVGPHHVADSKSFISQSSLSELVANYEEQCQEAGWQHVAGAIAERVAWGTWHFKVKLRTPWTLTYTLIQEPDDSTFFISMPAIARFPLTNSIEQCGGENYKPVGL